AEIEAL
ncbi:hypothetical protein MK338_11625, partial [Streptococcus vestibularis]|nr:hypothetical protein [Streptococcus vestibularis]